MIRLRIVVFLFTTIAAAQSHPKSPVQFPNFNSNDHSTEFLGQGVFASDLRNARHLPLLPKESVQGAREQKNEAQQPRVQSQNSGSNGANQAAAKNKKETPSNASEEVDRDSCGDQDQENQHSDCRGVFVSSFYIGLAIDTFAGDDMLKYLNPGDSGKIHERAIGGIDFEYRLLGDRMPAVRFRDVPTNQKKPIESGKPCDPSKGEDCLNVEWRPKNFWVYGETMHGVRSADIDCSKNPDLPVCAKSLPVSTNPDEQLYYILRNATSLEGFVGFRWEFLGLQQKSASPANLYLKGQAGFLSLAGAQGSAMDVDQIALGAVATKGNYQNSYLEVGFGRSDMFATARRKRVKVDGYLQRKLAEKTKVLSATSLFVQMFVDTDLGRGSDAIQTFVGLNFDLTKLLSTSKASSQNDEKNTGGGRNPSFR